MHRASDATLPEALRARVQEIFWRVNRDPSFLVVFDSKEDSVRILDYALQFATHSYEGQVPVDEGWDVRLYTFTRHNGKSQMHVVTTEDVLTDRKLFWLDELHAPE